MSNNNRYAVELKNTDGTTLGGRSQNQNCCASEKSNGLYLHIPFCRSKCVYCNFVSFAGRQDEFERYTDALVREMSLRSGGVKEKIFDTVYMGGGTPSVLPLFLFTRIFEAVNKYFHVDKNAEITVEVNPCDVNEQLCKLFKQTGINRVSLGLQSVNESTLKFLGRRHTVSGFADAVRAFQKAGITNLSGDIILGLPEQDENEVKAAVKLFEELNLKHASIYALKVESGTPLKKMVANGTAKLPDDDRTADLYELLVEQLSAMGFNRYEVSNFCKDGFHSRHNLNCWLCCEYLGLGISAHSHMCGKRFSNVRKIENYCGKIKEGILPVSKSVTLTETEKINERIMLGLRLESGFSCLQLNKDFGIDYLRQCENAGKLLNLKLIKIENDFVKILPEKFYIMNMIISELLF